MKRIWTSTLAVSLFVLPACKGGASADAVKLIPDGAEAIAGINLKTVTGSEVWKTYSAKIPDDGVKEFDTTLGECNLKMDALDAVVFGMTQKGDFSVVIAGEGIGDPDNATCMVNKMNEKNGDSTKVSVEQVDGLDVINATDGRMFLVSKNMVAFASTSWQDSVAKLIGGEGTSAIDGNQKDLYKKADTKAAVWFTGIVPSEMAGQAPKGMADKAASVKNIVGKVDLSNGVALELIAGFGDEDSATGAATELQGLIDQFGPMAGEELAGVVKSVKVEAKGTDVNLAVSATMADLEAASKMAGM